MKIRKVRSRSSDLVGHVIETSYTYGLEGSKRTMSIQWMDGSVSENIPQPFAVECGDKLILPFREYPKP